MTLRIKSWDKFQHYKSGKNASKRPEWIRLYTRLLDDIEFDALSGDDAKALVMLWALASEQEGDLPDTKTIAFRLRLTEQKLEQILGRLSHWIEGGPRTEEKRVEEKRVEEKRVEENRIEEKRERGRAHALPLDWNPSENHFTQGSELGFAVPQIEAMAEDMRLWAGANGATKKNWGMAFSSWMRRESKRAPPRKDLHTSLDERFEEIRRRTNDYGQSGNVRDGNPSNVTVLPTQDERDNDRVRRIADDSPGRKASRDC